MKSQTDLSKKLKRLKKDNEFIINFPSVTGNLEISPRNCSVNGRMVCVEGNVFFSSDLPEVIEALREIQKWMEKK